MKRPALKDMTLRQKIGQTGFPSPRQLLDSVIEFGGYDKYLQEYPFTGVYLWRKMWDHKNETPATPEESAKLWKSVSDACEIPLLVAADGEHGASYLFDELHKMPALMALGAAQSAEMAYKRSYYYAKEMKLCGVNWSFSPVFDLCSHLLSGTIRPMSDNPDKIISMIPHMLKAYEDAGIASTAKHFPGGFGEFRNTHFTNSVNRMSKEQWYSTYGRIWQAAVDANVPSIMVRHSALPCIDDSYAKGTVYRPASASKKIVDILRQEMGYKGVIVTDGLSMKAITGAFEHDDMYIECFNAGNDILLFCSNDYIDVMEKAIADGRVSMEQLDASVERILDMKEALGLFDNPELPAPLTEEENAEIANLTYEVATKAATLINNIGDIIPVNSEKVKNIVIVKISGDDDNEAEFDENLKIMVDTFAGYGVKADIRDGLKSKAETKELSEQYDLIVMVTNKTGMPFFFEKKHKSTMMASMSYGAEKTVVIAFGTPAIYYTYFEQSNAFICTCSVDKGAARAVVDGMMGKFEFVGQVPIKLSL